MSEVRGLHEAYSWSLSRLAECFGVHRNTLAKKVREHGLVPTGEVRGNPIYSIREVAEMLLAPAQDDGDQPLNWDSMPEQRKAWYQSENERVKLERELRMLIPVDEVHRETSKLAKAMAAGLDGLPDMLERDAGLPPEAIERAERVIDVLREQVYRSVIDDAGGGEQADG